uniref:Uncharacterized protein n=1 Tax=Palpitomonas bilix TaxID=652834 RepID=A0A7S3D5E8_9EUKA|mmetsp:Transcript_20592/g.52935  ORF Transcript_20592/g.52935 Transcript_20592/m.52935 type:complete len:493 (+) Transcript_20592:272-1750(+)
MEKTRRKSRPSPMESSSSRPTSASNARTRPLSASASRGQTSTTTRPSSALARPSFSTSTKRGEKSSSGTDRAQRADAGKSKVKNSRERDAVKAKVRSAVKKDGVDQRSKGGKPAKKGEQREGRQKGTEESVICDQKDEEGDDDVSLFRSLLRQRATVGEDSNAEFERVREEYVSKAMYELREEVATNALHSSIDVDELGEGETERRRGTRKREEKRSWTEAEVAEIKQRRLTGVVSPLEGYQAATLAMEVEMDADDVRFGRMMQLCQMKVAYAKIACGEASLEVADALVFAADVYLTAGAIEGAKEVAVEAYAIASMLKAGDGNDFDMNEWEEGARSTVGHHKADISRQSVRSAQFTPKEIIALSLCVHAAFEIEKNRYPPCHVIFSFCTPHYIQTRKPPYMHMNVCTHYNGTVSTFKIPLSHALHSPPYHPPPICLTPSFGVVWARMGLEMQGRRCTQRPESVCFVEYHPSFFIYVCVILSVYWYGARYCV